jgi:hypothetical protein
MMDMLGLMDVYRMMQRPGHHIVVNPMLEDTVVVSNHVMRTLYMNEETKNSIIKYIARRDAGLFEWRLRHGTTRYRIHRRRMLRRQK